MILNCRYHVYRIIASDISLKLDALGYISVAESISASCHSRLKRHYWHKQRYRVFVPPFGGLRGNVHSESMARWKARGRLPISAN